MTRRDQRCGGLLALRLEQSRVHLRVHQGVPVELGLGGSKLLGFRNRQPQKSECRERENPKKRFHKTKTDGDESYDPRKRPVNAWDSGSRNE